MYLSVLSVSRDRNVFQAKKKKRIGSCNSKVEAISGRAVSRHSAEQEFDFSTGLGVFLLAEGDTGAPSLTSYQFINPTGEPLSFSHSSSSPRAGFHWPSLWGRPGGSHHDSDELEMGSPPRCGARGRGPPIQITWHGPETRRGCFRGCSVIRRKRIDCRADQSGSCV